MQPLQLALRQVRPQQSHHVVRVPARDRPQDAGVFVAGGFHARHDGPGARRRILKFACQAPK